MYLLKHTFSCAKPVQNLFIIERDASSNGE